MCCVVCRVCCGVCCDVCVCVVFVCLCVRCFLVWQLLCEAIMEVDTAWAKQEVVPRLLDHLAKAKKWYTRHHTTTISSLPDLTSSPTCTRVRGCACVCGGACAC
jgi:hypothetical protein